MTSRRVLLLSNFTSEWLKRFFTQNENRLASELEFEIGPYDQIVEHISTIEKSNTSFHRIIVLVTLDKFIDEDLFRQNPPSLVRDIILNRISIFYDEILFQIKNTEQNIFISPILPSYRWQSIAPLISPFSLKDFVFYGKQSLIEKSRSLRLEGRVITPNLGIDLLDRSFHDFHKDYFFKQVFAKKGFEFISNEILQSTCLRVGAKILFVDGDNALWGGILGEEGPNGVLFGTESPAGDFFLKFQNFLKALKNQGMLLALVTKNNLTDIEELFGVRKDFTLSLSDFAYVKASWQPKSKSISEVLDSASLLSDSAVFIDDSIFEINEVKSQMPDVNSILIEPKNLDLTQIIEGIRLGTGPALTSEDLSRTQLLQEEQNRQSLRSSSSYSDYLFGLELELKMFKLESQDKVTMERVAQLFTKTNQFNFATERLNLSDISRRMQSGEDFWCARLSDKFGSYGLIGVVHLQFVQDSRKKLLVKNFILSCRAMGRSVESAMLKLILGYFLPEEVNVTFSPTKKNFPAKAFLEDLLSNDDDIFNLEIDSIMSLDLSKVLRILADNSSHIKSVIK